MYDAFTLEGFFESISPRIINLIFGQSTEIFLNASINSKNPLSLIILPTNKKVKLLSSILLMFGLKKFVSKPEPGINDTFDLITTAYQ